MTHAWQTLDVAGRLFESARWLPGEDCFQWVDILTCTIYRWFPATEALDAVQFDYEYLPLATPASKSGVQIVASQDTLYTYRWGGSPTPLAVLPVGSDARLNDGIVDTNGGVWVGSMATSPDPENPRGKLWRVDGNGHAVEMLTGIGISNGIVWTDSVRGFYVDSLYRTLDVLTLTKQGPLRTPVLQVAAPGEPDGIALAAGRVWVAIWEGFEVAWVDCLTFERGGVAVPCARPASVAFSEHLMFVTSGGRGAGADLDRSGQALFRELPVSEPSCAQSHSCPVAGAGWLTSQHK